MGWFNQLDEFRVFYEPVIMRFPVIYVYIYIGIREVLAHIYDMNIWYMQTNGVVKW